MTGILSVIGLPDILPETGPKCQRSVAGGELDRDRRAAAGLARDADRAAVLLDDLLGDRQAEAGPAVLRREIEVEDPFDGLPAHAGPAVAHGDRGDRAVAADGHRQLAALADGFDGVGDDVAEGRLELVRVAA